MHQSLAETGSGRSQPPSCAPTDTLRRRDPDRSEQVDANAQTFAALAAALAARFEARTFSSES